MRSISRPLLLLLNMDVWLLLLEKPVGMELFFSFEDIAMDSY